MRSAFSANPYSVSYTDVSLPFREAGGLHVLPVPLLPLSIAAPPDFGAVAMAPALSTCWLTVCDRCGHTPTQRVLYLCLGGSAVCHIVTTPSLYKAAFHTLQCVILTSMIT